MNKLLGFLIMAMFLTGCSGTTTMPLSGSFPVPEVVAPGPAFPIPAPPVLPAEGFLNPPLQNSWPDTLPVPMGLEDVKARFAQAEAEGKLVETDLDADFGDPNRQNPCQGKPGLPPGAKKQEAFGGSPGSRFVTQYWVDNATGLPIAQGVLGEFQVGLVTNHLKVFSPYEGRGIATQLALELNKRWVDVYGPGFRLVFINLHEKEGYKYSCYWSNYTNKSSWRDEDGSIYPSHILE